MAKDIGKEAYQKFTRERLQTDAQVNFFERLSKLKLKTFTYMTKTKKTSVKGKEIMLITTSQSFGNMLLLAQSRKLDMRVVLEYPPGPLPRSLSTPDDCPRKTSKAALSNAMQSKKLYLQSSKPLIYQQA